MSLSDGKKCQKNVRSDNFLSVLLSYVIFLSDFWQNILTDLIFLKCQIDRNGHSDISVNTYWHIFMRLYIYLIESVYEIQVLLFFSDLCMILMDLSYTFWYILCYWLSKCQNLLFSRLSKENSRLLAITHYTDSLQAN